MRTSILLAILVLSSLILPVKANEYREIEWIELMPADDLEALLNPPDYLDEIEDGSFEDQISGQFQRAMEASTDDRYQQALVSTNVIAELDQQKIRLPGFIVPLEFDSKQRVTQFFLVPYFGACIHVPPPPPNQIIYADYSKGLKQENLYDAFWINGTLHVDLVENDVATSAYRFAVDTITPYTEE